MPQPCLTSTPVMRENLASVSASNGAAPQRTRLTLANAARVVPGYLVSLVSAGGTQLSRLMPCCCTAAHSDWGVNGRR